MSVKVQYARCWGCMTGQCYNPPQAHTWMDEEDAKAANVNWPMSAEAKQKSPCACQCAGGPGACVTYG